MCCRILPLPVLNKPKCVLCQHCTEGHGCAIYTSRPEICRSYKCGWLGNSWLSDDLRPDRSGIIVDGARDGSAVLLICDAEMFAEEPERFEQLQQLINETLEHRPMSIMVVPDARCPTKDITYLLLPGETQEQVLEALLRDRPATATPTSGPTDRRRVLPVCSV